MTLPINVLDRGYVNLVLSWGSDEQIIEAARMSTSGSFKGWPEDERLLSYLWKHKHMSPFEMAGATFEIQAPIFVFREWHRHRTQSYNELSARYSVLPELDYFPSIERVMVKSRDNKQASAVKGAPELTTEQAKDWLKELEVLYVHAQRVYTEGLRAGVPKELARLAIPVARYSRMRASANLRNWLGFLALRLPSNAQWEIQQYANAVGVFIRQQFPHTWKLFAEDHAK